MSMKISESADGDSGAVAVGDLLTSSPTPGHAMHARNPERALGSVSGKALADPPTGHAARLGTGRAASADRRL